MSRAYEEKNDRLCSIGYILDKKECITDIYEWLTYVANNEYIEVREINLDNWMDRSDEETKSTLLGRISSKEILKRQCVEREISSIALWGMYKKKKVLVSVGMESNKFSVSLVTDDINELEELVKLLKLS